MASPSGIRSSSGAQPATTGGPTATSAASPSIAVASSFPGSQGGPGVTASPPPGIARLSVAETAADLLDPRRVDIGVWAMIDHLGLGVYRADGTQVLPGSETGSGSVWLYDFQVAVLARMASAPALPFSTYTSYLAANGAKTDAPALLRAYADAYRASPKGYVPELVSDLGLAYAGDPQISPLVEWLLFLDTFVPRNSASAAAAGDAPVPSGDPIAVPAAAHAQAARGQTSVCMISGDGEPSAWGAAHASALLAALIQQIRAADLMFEGMLLGQSIAVVSEQSGDAVHEGHDGPGGSVRFAVHAQGNFVPIDPLCGLPGVTVFAGVPIGPFALAGLDVVWKLEPDAALQHGQIREADPGVPFGNPATIGGAYTGQTSTTGSGETAIEFQAREEPSRGKGNESRLGVQVDVEFIHLDRALEAAGFPPDLASAVPPLPPRTLGFDLSWHSLDEHWSGTVAASSHVVFHGPNATFLECTENWTLVLSFQVDATGSVDGSGTGTLDGLENCHSNFGYKFDTATTLAFNMKGTETDSALNLQLLETRINGANQGLLNYTMFFTTAYAPRVLSVPRVLSDRAEGTVTVSATADNGEVADGTHLFQLVCADCSPKP